MILNKSSDILQSVDPQDIKKYRKPSQEIKDLKLEWSKRIQQHQKEAYTDKEKAALKQESVKYELLSSLMKEIDILGSFDSDDQVKQFMSLDKSEEEKVKRLYKEVRYTELFHFH